MNASSLISVAAIALLGGISQAQVVTITVPDQVPLPASTVTRGHTLAEYHIWRLSGLQALDQGDRGPNLEGLEYRQAQAKYELLRTSPDFSTLVAELSRRPPTFVQARNGTEAMASK